jgi:transcriptional regulator with XRE-family HTH domain
MVRRVPVRPPILAALGTELQSLREERGLSQERLAERCHVHRNYVGGIERGERNPTLEVLERLARGLELRVSELVARAEKRLPG